MKITVIFLAFSFAILTGCSTSYTYPEKNITVLKKSGALKQYELLSVRGDSAITVLDWKERKSEPLPFSHVEVISRDSIAFIYRDYKGTSRTLVSGGIGLGIGAIFAISILSSPSEFLDLRGIAAAASIILCTTVGLVIGVVVDAFSYMDLSLDSPKDREFLRSITAYPDKEPEEMQYIK